MIVPGIIGYRLAVVHGLGTKGYEQHVILLVHWCVWFTESSLQHVEGLLFNCLWF